MNGGGGDGVGEGSRVAENYTPWWSHSEVTTLTVGAAFPVRKNDKAGGGRNASAKEE